MKPTSPRGNPPTLFLQSEEIPIERFESPRRDLLATVARNGLCQSRNRTVPNVVIATMSEKDASCVLQLPF